MLGSSHRRNFTGIILTMVNARKHSRYGHEDLALYKKELISGRIPLAARRGVVLDYVQDQSNRDEIFVRVLLVV
jgi:hypothetical protein